MQLKAIFLSAILAATVAYAAVNEPCYGAGGAPGVCVSKSTCSSSGGKSSDGGCPRDKANIKCCVKPKCKGSSGNCRWKSDCKGTALTGQCPGPGSFKCCQSAANGFGGYKTPRFPTAGTSVNACKAVSVRGAKLIVKAWPGRIREIGCTRKCGCGVKGGSDHCCGKAVDLMCADGGGVPTSSGRQIAEWVIKNHKTLKLKYVIWGQRIWNPSHGQKAWTKWQTMEDRHSITQNHWDHVHVSFK